MFIQYYRGQFFESKQFSDHKVVGYETSVVSCFLGKIKAFSLKAVKVFEHKICTGDRNEKKTGYGHNSYRFVCRKRTGQQCCSKRTNVRTAARTMTSAPEFR